MHTKLLSGSLNGKGHVEDLKKDLIVRGREDTNPGFNLFPRKSVRSCCGQGNVSLCSLKIDKFFTY
jgi:hypothetical protein